jgi:hypothetical protein
MQFLREPLVHFLLLGTMLFGVSALVGDRSRERTGQIVVTPGHLEHVLVSFTRTWQRPPRLLAAVRQAVQRAWFAARRKAMNEQCSQRLRARYPVVVEPLPAASDHVPPGTEARTAMEAR